MSRAYIFDTRRPESWKVRKSLSVAKEMKRVVVLTLKFVCEGLSKISSNFTLHLIKVGKLKRLKKVSSDLKAILKTDLADLRLLAVS